jgi:hypothetical protein
MIVLQGKDGALVARRHAEMIPVARAKKQPET